MIRIVILEYRDQLVKLQRQAVNQAFPFAPATVNVSTEKLEEERNLVIRDLLSNMQKIPLTVIGGCAVYVTLRRSRQFAADRGQSPVHCVDFARQYWLSRSSGPRRLISTSQPGSIIPM